MNDTFKPDDPDGYRNSGLGLKSPELYTMTETSGDSSSDDWTQEQILDKAISKLKDAIAMVESIRGMASDCEDRAGILRWMIGVKTAEAALDAEYSIMWLNNFRKARGMKLFCEMYDKQECEKQ